MKNDQTFVLKPCLLYEFLYELLYELNQEFTVISRVGCFTSLNISTNNILIATQKTFAIIIIADF